MDDPILKDDENDIKEYKSDSNESDSDYKENDWNIDIKLEENFMKKLIENKLFYKPDLCPCFNIGIFEIKKKYDTTLIGGLNHLNKSRMVAIDECLIGHNKNGEQIWIIDDIKIKDKKIRMILSKERNSVILPEFVNSFF